MAFSFFKKKPTNAHYLELVVKDIRQETPDTSTIVFHQPKNKVAYRAGQFITFLLSIEGKEVRRSYSFSTSPDVDSDIAVTIKRVANGIVSNQLLDQTKVGDTLRVLEPLGNFTTEWNKTNERFFTFFAGGSGITPVFSLIKTLLAQEPKSKAALVYANRDEASIIFKKQLDDVEKKYNDRFFILYVLDNPPTNWNSFSGFLTPDMLQTIAQKISFFHHAKNSYWICGPEMMMNVVTDFLASQNIDKHKIHKENFNTTAPKPSAPTSNSTERTVTIRYSGEEFTVNVPSGKFILESSLEQGHDLPYSCQSGMCTACRGKAVSGKVAMVDQEGLTPSELEEGYVLTCVGKPESDDVVIEIG